MTLIALDSQRHELAQCMQSQRSQRTKRNSFQSKNIVKQTEISHKLKQYIFLTRKGSQDA